MLQGCDSHSSPPPGHGVLDSGATTTVLAGELHRFFTQYETAPDSHVMATAASGGTLEITGGGTAGMFTGVMHSHDLRYSVVSVSQLTIHGFRVTFSGDTAEVIHPDGQRIECVTRHPSDWSYLSQYTARSSPESPGHGSGFATSSFRQQGQAEVQGPLRHLRKVQDRPTA
jgi:hypothetical protein